MTSHSFEHTPRVHIGRYDRVTLRGIAYHQPVTDANGHLLRRVDAPDLMEAFSHREFELAQKEPGYIYDREWFHPDRVRARLISGLDAMSDLAEHETAAVRIRHAYVSGFLELESRGETNRSDTQVEAALDVLHAKISKREHTKAKLSRETALEQRQKARRNGTRT